MYAGFKPGSQGMDEVTAAKKMYDIIFPKLHDHQKAMLVPGMKHTGRNTQQLSPTASTLGVHTS